MSEGQPPPSQQQTQPKQQQNAQQQQVVQSQQQTPPQQQQAPPPHQQAPSPQQQAPPPQQQAPPPQQQAPPPQQQVQPPQQQVHPQQQTQQQQQLQQQQHHQHHGQQQQVVQPQQQQTVAQQQQQHIQQAIPQQQIQQLQHIQPQQIQQPQHHVLGNMQPQTMTSVPLSMTMAPNPQNPVMAGAAASIRPQLPQVQVIHQAMHSPPYLPQFSYNQQQQLMLQNMQAAMSMNPQFNMANMAVAMQGRPGTNMFTPAGTIAASPTTPTTPINLNASSGANTHMTTSMTTVPNQTKPAVANGNKQQQTQVQQQQQQQLHAQIGQVQQAQATAMIGGKPIILGQTTGQPLLSGQIGVISAGQLPTTQAYGAAGQAFGQIQSKAGQQLGVATNPAQAQLMTSQAPIRFSQQQLVSNAGQIISSQPVLSNQMLQAMASLQQQQQYPGQMMSAPGQSPTIITGQGLYIRSANPVQAQGLMANVQAAINPTFKPNQQPVQNQSMPIQKQTTAAQTGKVLLPSATKVSTAKVAPTNSVLAMAKSMTSGATGKPKGRPKGSTTRPVSTSGVTAVTKTESISSVSKPSTPTIQTAALATPTDTKSQSDSELEVPKKQPANNIPAAITDHNEEQAPEIEEKPVDINDANKDNECLQESLPAAIIEQPVEKQRAIVKPHILTHVIEGFVIQEGPEPFPVQRSSLLTEFIPPKPGQPVEQSSLISMDEDDLDHEEDSSHSPGPIDGENSQSTLTCECCGRVELASKFHRSQRFCSTTCAKRYNIGCTRRLGLFPGKPKEKGAGGRVLKRKRHTKTRKDQRGGRSLSTGSLSHDLDNEEQSSSISGQEESVSPATTPDHRLHTPPPELHMETDQIPLTSPTKWNVQDVYEFIRSLPGCSPYADEFRSQEIDGQALLLLKEDHLMTAMNMKLGPALKICAKINAIKEETG